MYQATVVADSLSPEFSRLTTMLVTYPRFIHCEMLRHRWLSRNTGSSRAIPTDKLIAMVRKSPFIPIHIGQNQRGMSAANELPGEIKEAAIFEWETAAKSAADHAEALLRMGVHKQIANRVLEPFLWVTEVITGDNRERWEGWSPWEGFFHLRISEAAQPEIREIATLMRDAYDASRPEEIEEGGWHTPLVYKEEFEDWETRIAVSVARCARVSYGREAVEKQRGLEEDLDLYKRLWEANHRSPFEHQACPFPLNRSSGLRFPPAEWGNLYGWRTLRSLEACVKEQSNE